MNELANIGTTNIYQIALQSRKISEMKKGELVKELTDILTKTYYDAGQVMPGYNTSEQIKNLQVLSAALFDELKSFQYLRIEEIRIAFKSGVRGEYGDWFGINIKTFYQWLKGWQNDEKRKSALYSIKLANERDYAPVMDEKEAEYGYKLTIESQFETYKQKRIFNFYMPYMLFKDFEARGMISVDDGEKRAIMAQAMKKMEERCRIERTNPKSKQHLSELSDRIRRIESNELTSSDKQLSKAIAAEICLKKYFDSIDKIIWKQQTNSR